MRLKPGRQDHLKAPIPPLSGEFAKSEKFYYLTTGGLALAITEDGHKELLGLWISENEGSKFWLGVLTDLQNRGVKDIFITCVDGLTGFPEAIAAAFPRSQVQLCIVHMVRNSLRYVSSNDVKAVAKDLKAIYNCGTLTELALDEFSKKWSDKYPSIRKILAKELG